MRYIQPQTNEDLVQWGNDLAHIMKQRSRNDVAEEIEKYIKQFQQDVFTIAVIGKAKRGKSTLINALMGRSDDTLAPIDKLPASSAITRFRWGTEAKARVHFQDGHTQDIAWESIRDYVTEERNRENTKGVATVVVEGPIAGLQQRVELVDTPGAGSIHEHHDAILHAFIPQADAVIFIVTAQMPFDQDELELLSQVKKADISKVFFVINRVDEIDEDEDLQNTIKHNQALLTQTGIHCDTLYQISAKNAFLGRQNNGVDILAKAIEDFIAKERIAIQRKRFISRVCALIEPEAQVLSTTLGSITKSDAELEGEIKTLETEYRKMEETAQTLGRQFEIDWNNAVSVMQKKLSPAKELVHKKIQSEFDKYSSWGVSQLAKKLPTVLVQTIEAELQPISEQFEKQAQSLCKSLQESYPVINMDAQSRLTIRPNGMKGALITTIGGVGAIAGGTTFATAGIITASSIAAANTAAAAAAATAAAAAAEAAMASAATAVNVTAVTSGLSGVVSLFTGNILGAIGSFGTLGATVLGGADATIAAAGTAAAAATPAAATISTPLWVALAGPIGWTVAGLGLVAIPLAWSCHKSKQKNQMYDQVEKKIDEVFKAIKDEKVPELRQMGKDIVNSFSSNLSNKKQRLKKTLEEIKQNRPDQAEIQKMVAQCERLNQLMLSVSNGQLCLD